MVALFGPCGSSAPGRSPRSHPAHIRGLERTPWLRAERVAQRLAALPHRRSRPRRCRDPDRWRGRRPAGPGPADGRGSRLQSLRRPWRRRSSRLRPGPNPVADGGGGSAGPGRRRPGRTPGRVTFHLREGRRDRQLAQVPFGAPRGGADHGHRPDGSQRTGEPRPASPSPGYRRPRAARRPVRESQPAGRESVGRRDPDGGGRRPELVPRGSRDPAGLLQPRPVAAHPDPAGGAALAHHGGAGFRLRARRDGRGHPGLWGGSGPGQRYSRRGPPGRQLEALRGSRDQPVGQLHPQSR